MAAKKLEIVPAQQHFLFAYEVIHGLNEFYKFCNIRVELKQELEKFSRRYVNDDILQAILIISYVFRKDLRKEVQKNIEEFKNYCAVIPVSRNSHYFFNFLRRVSLIYEMAIYCYMRITKEESKEEVNYFEIAQNCIAQYEDVDYFQSAGSWPILNRFASFFTHLGRALLPVILEERNHLRYLLSFPDTVERIERRLEKQNKEDILNSADMRFLIETKEKIIAREPVVMTEDSTEGNGSQVGKKTFTRRLQSMLLEEDRVEDIIRCKIQTIMDYFNSFLRSKTLNEEEHSSAGYKYERGNTPDSFKAESSSKDTIAPSESNCLTTQSMTNLKEKYSKNVHCELNTNLDEYIPKIKSQPGTDDNKALFALYGSVHSFPSSDKCSEGGDRTSNSELLARDLYLSDDESSQQSNVKKELCNPSLMVKYELFPSPESNISETQLPREDISSPENNAMDFKLLHEYKYSLEFSDSENLHQLNMKNEPCEESYSSVSKNALISPCSNTDNESFHENEIIEDMLRPMVQPHSSVVPLIRDGVDSNSRTTEFLADILKHSSRIRTEQENVIEKSESDSDIDIKLLHEYKYSLEFSDSENLHHLNMKNEPCEESYSSVSKNVLISPCSNSDNESFHENEIIEDMLRPMVQPHSSVVPSIRDGVDSNSRTTEFLADSLKHSLRIRTEQENVIEKSECDSDTDIKDSSTNPQPSK